jgi:hypothetical protein
MTFHAFAPEVGSRWTNPIGEPTLRHATITELDGTHATLIDEDDGAVFVLPVAELLRRWTRRRDLRGGRRG